MLFNSFDFLVFFVAVSSLYFLMPHGFRWLFLLLASCYFYMAFVPIYILILGFTIVIDYVAGIVIEQSKGKNRKRWLVLSLVSNIAVLAFFKYYNFFIDNLNLFIDVPEKKLHYLGILLPIGLSFHTFQAMSYTIEVYRKNQKAERHFGIYALYVMFYPQLVAGPIERPQNMLWQFREPHRLVYGRVVAGLKLMAWGFFKKIVIADRLAPMVDFVYDNPTNFEGLPLVIATVFFAFQIFCDFSGYCDIALGAAQVMGFRLMQNFERPYSAVSISAFWSRWHISLSSWFRDYLYIPLGGNRVSMQWLWYRNLMLVFIISGLWHGANWTFVVWGMLHGLYLIAEIVKRNFLKNNAFIQQSKPLKSILYHFLPNRLLTFGLVCVAWVFFRANTLGDAQHIVTHFLSHWSKDIQQILTDETGIKRINLLYLGTDKVNFLMACGFIVLMETVHYLQKKGILHKVLTQKPTWIRWSLYVGLVLMILWFA